MNLTIVEHLNFLYGSEAAEEILPRLAELIERYQPRLAGGAADFFDERDVVLITYGDMAQAAGERPLRALASFLRQQVAGVVNTIHLLPFYPYSSDDGFSVIDYWAVDPALGTWADVAEIGHDFRLMFDAVINHISAQSDWFQGFLRGEPPFSDYFVVPEPGADVTAVFRPRALPLLTDVQTAAGPRRVWTTFSADQIDLNFANPDVLLKISELLLFYVAQGARLIRLDAIAFMWKEVGTSCLHLPQTHRIIQLWRSILDLVAPQVALITETNVPHEDNIAYFGNGRNEAQLVYNFSLPPLTLHAFHNGRADILATWAQTLTLPSDRTTFFNFLASHDGIGLTPARGLLPETAVSDMAARVLRLGGQVSYRANPDGSQTAYELNINYLDALADPDAPDEPIDLIARRFLTAQAIMLALRGVPGIYFHSLFGSRGWPDGVPMTGRARTINRQKLDAAHLTAELGRAGSLRQQVFAGYRGLLQARSRSAAFHPNGKQEILFWHPALFAVRRTAPDGAAQALCLHNVSREPVIVALPPGRFIDLLGQRPFSASALVTIRPYQTIWLQEGLG